MAITAEQRIDALKAVVGTFDMVPGAANFSSLVPALEQGATQLQLIESFVAHPAFGGLYPNFQTSEEFANSYFATLLNGTVTGALFDEVIDIATSALNSGTSIASLIDQAVTYLSNTTDPGFNSAFQGAADLLANKVMVAEHHSIVLQLDVESPDGSDLDEVIEDHQDVLINITDDPQTVVDTKAQLDDIAAAGDPITLTPQQDTVVGSTANDSIFAFINDDVALGTTLNSGDTIDGGLGNDTLFVTIEDTSDNNLNLNMINVEKIEVRDFDGQTFEMESVTGLNTISLVGGDDEDTEFDDGTYIVPNIEFHNVQGEINQDAGIVSVIPMLNVLVDNASAEVYTYSDNAKSTSNYSAATITSTGAGWNSGENYLYLGESTGASDITVMGETDLYLDIEQFDSLTSFDASGLDADLVTASMDFENSGTYIGAQGDDTIDDGSSAAKKVTYETGAGDDSLDLTGGLATYTVDLGDDDDTVMIDDSNATGDTIDGGDGSDELSVNNAMVATVNGLTKTEKAALNAAITNFEELSVRDQLTNDIDVVDFGGINSLSLDGGATTVMVDGLTTGGTLNINGASTSVTVNMTGATAGGADVLNLGIGDAAPGTVVAADIETVNLTSNVSSTLTLQAAAATALTVAGKGDIDIINVTNTKVSSLDGSAASGDIDFISANVTGDVTLAGGSGDDVLDASATIATKSATIDGNDGDDTLTGGADDDTINGGADDDIIVGGTGEDTIDGGDDDDTITGGAGKDTLTGGDGDDIFDYTGASTDSNGVNVDTITDFVSGEDLIDTAVLVVYSGEANGYGAVLTSLTGTAYQGVLDSSTSTLYIDVDGDALLDAADLAIDLTGVTDLSQTDFI